jgi:hypothetical protein
LGDARTKFFHANATIRHRRNSIAILKSKTRDIISSHPGKEELLWKSFKERIGNSDYCGMLFDLSSLL